MTRVISLRGGISLGLLTVLSMTGCAALSQTQEGAILGGTAGAVLGGVSGNQAGATARGGGTSSEAYGGDANRRLPSLPRPVRRANRHGCGHAARFLGAEIHERAQEHSYLIVKVRTCVVPKKYL